MDRTTSLGRRLRRGTLLIVLAVALVVALMPTAAFASSNDGRTHYSSYNRYSRQGQYNQRNYSHSDYKYNYDRDQVKRDYDRKGYDRYDGKQQYKHCATTYRVRRGDTLTKIARHYHTSVYALAKANGIRNANRIIAGQVLCIP